MISNKYRDYKLDIFLWAVSLMVLILPLVHLLYTGHNLILLAIMSFAIYGVYAFITISTVIYLIGSIKCSKSVAFRIVKELTVKSKWVDNIIPFYLSTISLCLILYKLDYIMAIIIMTPLLLNEISNHILCYKAKNNVSPN